MTVIAAGERWPDGSLARVLMERYLEVIDVEVATRAGYGSLIRTHILPLPGDLPVGRVRGEVVGGRCRGRRAASPP